MRYILFPGFSENNKKWGEELKKEFEKFEINLEVMEWDHWDTGREEDFELEHEVDKAMKIIGKDELTIIAKSIGSLVAVNIVHNMPEKVKRIVIMGVPYSSLSDKAQEAYYSLKKLPASKIKVMQNSQDTHGSFKEVRTFIGNIMPEIETVMLLRDDHYYPFNETLMRFVKED